MNEAPVPAAAPELRDFSDRLPPVLVKELRQGLRTRMFVVPFLVLHGLLVIGSLEGGSGFFWQCLCIMLVAVLPLRNISALSEERQANTLDTLILTRLTPWRIVWGKWSATGALVLLTAVSALPYLLVRYLNGGSSIVQEAAVLGGVVLISGALAAVLTGLSTLQTGVARHISGVVLIIAAYTLGCGPLLRMMEYESASPGIAAVMLIVTLWATLFSLGHAASSIAPAAMNLTTPRRLTTLAAVGIGSAICVFMESSGTSASYALLIILMVASLVEMGDQPSRHPGVGASFARHGLPGKLAALFLHPGWASGVVFCAALWLVVVLVLGFHPQSDPVANFAALCFFPVCVGAPLLTRRLGSTIMLCGVALAQLLTALAGALFPEERYYIARVLPSLGNRFDFPPGAALAWAGIALAIAIVPLAALLRRISRESNL